MADQPPQQTRVLSSLVNARVLCVVSRPEGRHPFSLKGNGGEPRGSLGSAEPHKQPMDQPALSHGPAPLQNRNRTFLSVTAPLLSFLSPDSVTDSTCWEAALSRPPSPASHSDGAPRRPVPHGHCHLTQVEGTSCAPCLVTVTCSQDFP